MLPQQAAICSLSWFLLLRCCCSVGAPASSGNCRFGPSVKSELDENVLLQVQLDIEETDDSSHVLLDKYRAELLALGLHLDRASRAFSAQRRELASTGSYSGVSKLADLLLEVQAVRSRLANTVHATERSQLDARMEVDGSKDASMRVPNRALENPWPDIVGEPSSSPVSKETEPSSHPASDPNDLTDPWPDVADKGNDKTTGDSDPAYPEASTSSNAGTSNNKKSKGKGASPWLILMLLVLFIIVLGAMVVIVAPMSVQETDGEKSKSTKGNAEVKVRSRFVQVVLPFWIPTAPDSCGLGFMMFFLCGVFSCTSACFWVSYIVVAIGREITPFVVKPDAATVGHGCLGSLALRIVTVLGLLVLPVLCFVRWKDIKARMPQWCLLNIVIFLILIRNAASVASSFITRIFMDAMIFSDAAIFWKCYWVQCGFLIFNTIVMMVRLYLQNVLGLQWRDHMTRFFMDLYMARRSYYMLDSYTAGDSRVDNPDQRIQEDASAVSVKLLQFTMDLLDSFIGLVSFATVLWNMKPSLTIVAVCYSMLGSVIGLLIAWKLVVINYITQRNEADFRFSLVHIRNNPEAIAFYGGEAREKHIALSRFDFVFQAIRWRIKWDAVCQGYMSFFSALATTLPPVILFSSYFRGDLDFGTISQAGVAFLNTMTSLSFVVSNVHLISDLSTAGNRLGSLIVLLRRPEEPSDLVLATTAEPELQITRLTASIPGGEKCIVRNLNVHYGSNEPIRVLLVGPSGIGKSSLLRIVAGLWKSGSGEVVRPPNAECLFLPQKPYMPLGDLRTQLVYPDEPDALEEPAPAGCQQLPQHVPAAKQLCEADLRQHLSTVGLEGLPDRFDEGFKGVCDWSRILSVGEQQRLASVRIFLRNPKLTILDEATSALPPHDEAKLYQRLMDANLSYISVGHRDTLIKFHDKVIELKGGGEWKLHTGKEFAEVQAKKNA